MAASRLNWRASALRRSPYRRLPATDRCGEEARLLKDVAERAAMGRHPETAVLPRLVAHSEPAARGAFQAGDAAQERRLAGARRAEDRRHPAGGEIEIHVERKARPVEPEAAVDEGDAGDAGDTGRSDHRGPRREREREA